jgi:hypothetical protein
VHLEIRVLPPVNDPDQADAVAWYGSCCPEHFALVHLGLSRAETPGIGELPDVRASGRVTELIESSGTRE